MKTTLHLAGKGAALLCAAFIVSGANAAQQDRAPKQIVDSVCSGCHATGKLGAPKIGDRAAWTKRLSKGLDVVVDAAVNGHDGMPSRGGMPQLERSELRGAILYMFNYGLQAPVAPGHK